MSDHSPNPRPYVTNVMAASLDGVIASHAKERDEARRALGFLDEADHARVCQILRETDAVIVGGRSVTASGGAFEIVNDLGRMPAWITVTSSLLPAALPFWQQTSVERWLVTPRAFSEPLPDPTVRIWTTDEASDWPARLLAELAARGMHRIVLFGGGELNRMFYAAGLVDALKLTVCPCILGAQDGVPLVRPPLPAPVALTLTASQVSGHLVFLDYIVRKS